MKRLQECIPLGPPPLSKEDGAGEGDRGLALCRAKGYEESEGRVVAMPGQMPTKNRRKTERTAGEEKGEAAPGRWTQWPAGMGTGPGQGGGGEGRG